MSSLPRENLAVSSLHRLKDQINQVSLLGVHAQSITERLQDYFESTKNALQNPRTQEQKYQLLRGLTEEIDDSSGERLWERAMMQRFSLRGVKPVPNCWERIIAFQVPLYSRQNQEGWGDIDLMGVYGGAPSIIELKGRPQVNPDGSIQTTNTPLKIVIQALAYAIAVRSHWNFIREEFAMRCQDLGISTQVQQDLEGVDIPIVAAAPADFWMNWLPVTNNWTTQHPESWIPFQSLLNRLAECHYPVRFVSISGAHQTPMSLAVQVLKFPPTSTTPS